MKPLDRHGSSHTNISLKWDFASQKKGAWPSGRVETGPSARVPPIGNQGPRTHTGETPVALSKNPKASCFWYKCFLRNAGVAVCPVLVTDSVFIETPLHEKRLAKNQNQIAIGIKSIRKIEFFLAPSVNGQHRK